MVATQLKLLLLVAGGNVLAYPLCEIQSSKHCNNTKKVIENSVLFVWNEGTFTVSRSALTAHGVVLALIMLPSVLANGALITTVIIQQRFRTPTNHLVISQCTVDIGMTLMVQMFSMIAIFQGGWSLSPTLCILQVILNRIFLYATVLHFALLSIDRYIVIVKSTRKERFTQNEIIVACGFLWLIAIVLGLPWDVFLFPSEVWFEVTSTFCFAKYVNAKTNKWFALIICRTILLLVVPGLIVIFCFYHILGVLRKNRRKVGPSTVSNWRRIAVAVYARSAYTSLAVVCSFFICMLPFIVAFGFSLIGKVVSYEAIATFKIILFANTAIKPIIYITRSAAWSKKLRRIWTETRKSKSKAMHSPVPNRTSRYIVGNGQKVKKASINMKLTRDLNLKPMSTRDFHEMFSVSGRNQAWSISAREIEN